MEQNINLNLNLVKNGKNYFNNNQSKSRRLETTSEYMDIDDFNNRDDAMKKRIFNPLNSYQSLSDLDEPQEK